ncbi:MAG: hypothetical protein A3B91_00670 [Candidatus Yanofskybacteria bacterium RIFCSPHIGHO2_02_FULL_41_29]|nr:MAG: hypothetical protein A3B91_00670 [Candidatus Yanofskybacteria bacterium RIFCSPHIGHO2_02_FULL_41_29]OGN17981.1 MAG: hypothetical protein A3F48_04760 [Candidatus Yanofskybacteria bacterium RIFCSPHIGHO2_12_FULL_41_9]OGN29241.1 MAG: hypothetical protein A3H54_03650 [Candidatus Yanofskybacteria bacterium RIFCSPLOWO2_02_FULL_41_13]OGN34829.1 MAG: hypothetical protein A3F98_01120 [Candidatus Yanofskybacteria bacterium RIFCSPLOWO2_12_FULL_41_8]
MNIFEEKIKFEKLLLAYKVPVLTVAYHGSLLGHVTPKSDLDVVLIIEDITPDLFRKINSITKKINAHLGISIVPVREAGTIFGGLKYLDALCRHYGSEDKYPYAYYKIATLNEQFRRSAIEMNLKKCENVAKIITKTINNFLGTNFKISVKTFDSLVNSLEKNLGLFYRHEKIKVGRYSERVETVR